LNARLNVKVSKLEEKVVKMESQSRRDNLLIDGISESDPEDCTEKVKHIFINTLKLDDVENMKLVRCHRLGPKRRGATKPRTVIIKFHWYGDKMRVWQARKNLKDTNIYLNDDFPKEIQDKRRILRPIMQKARATDHREAYISMDTLVIDGTRYTTDDLDKLPSDLNPAKIATQEVGNMLVFFTGQSPLSNFYKSDFTVKGQTFDCMEKFYVKEKADFANDPVASMEVMSASTPQECHKISQKLNKKINMKLWMEVAHKVMFEGVKTKFEQNDYLKKYLLNTQELSIVEENPWDTYWSCGVAMKDREKLIDRENWPGRIHLGIILMDVRSALRT